MAAFRFGALRDLFGRSDDSKRRKPEEARTKLEALREEARAAREAQQETQDQTKSPPEDMKQDASEKVARGARKPSEASDSYTAADIEVLEGLEPVRRRPGMYVGGTDEKALHHLFAEVIDNAMDEAVAGHATWIEVEVEADGFLPSPTTAAAFPSIRIPSSRSKSALEVIMTTLHSGGKFDSKVYNTSGGLHGVGVSVVNALSEKLEVEVARGQQLYAMDLQPRRAAGQAAEARRHQEPARHQGALQARREDLRQGRHLQAGAPACAWPAPRPTCSAASRSAGRAQPRSSTTTRRRRRRFHFPGGLKEYLEATIDGQTRVTKDIFAGRIEREGGHGSVEWAVCWVADEDGFLNSYCNTIPTPEGGTHENGFRSALVARPCATSASASATGAPARSPPTTCWARPPPCSRCSSASPSSRARPRTGSPPRRPRASSRTRCAMPSTTGWPTRPQQATKLLDWAIDQAEERLKRKREKEIGRQTRDAQAAPARQARRLQPQLQAGHRDLHRRGRLAPAARPSRRATASARPSCPCAARSSTSPTPRRRSCRRTSCCRT